MRRLLRRSRETFLFAIAPGHAPALDGAVRVMRTAIGECCDSVGLVDEVEAEGGDWGQVGMPRFEDQPCSRNSAQQQHDGEDYEGLLTFLVFVGHNGYSGIVRPVQERESDPSPLRSSSAT